MARKKKNEEANVLEGLKVDITRGVAFKANMSDHGGKTYETMDFSASRTAYAVPTEQAEEVSAELLRICQEEINAATEELDRVAAEVADEEDNEDTPKKKKKRSKKNDIGIDQDELEGIKDLVQEMIDSEDLDELKEVQSDIKERADKLSETQLEYLRSHYKKLAKQHKKNG